MDDLTGIWILKEGDRLIFIWFGDDDYTECTRLFFDYYDLNLFKPGDYFVLGELTVKVMHHNPYTDCFTVQYIRGPRATHAIAG